MIQRSPQRTDRVCGRLPRLHALYCVGVVRGKPCDRLSSTEILSCSFFKRRLPLYDLDDVDAGRDDRSTTG
jgi:hypothetical protein